MSDQSKKWTQLTLWDMDDVTTSLASEDGITPLNLPVGPEASPSGQDHALVSPIQTPAKDSETPTSETCGPPSSISFASADLSSFLASKCQELSSTVGSMVYVQTWKERVTPAGTPYWEHTARARTTSDNDSIGWHTPRARGDAGGSRWESGDLRNLEDQAKTVLSPYPTPLCIPDSPKSHGQLSGDYRRQMEPILHGWVTVTSRDGTRGSTEPRPQDTGVQLDQMATLVITGETTTSSTLKTAKRGVLNPALSRWLMGYPEAWCVAAIKAFRSMPKRRAKGVK